VAIALDEVQAFIVASFRSVWTLEVLRLLRAEPERAFARTALVEALRASALVVDQSLAALLAAGLVVTDREGSAQYSPASQRLGALAEAAEQLYAKSPDAVRRLIVAAANPGITAFADAFKLKGD
jgi:DNA-binding transcriptional ArsR family regulator